jgi:hypothetical protein
MRPTSIWRGCAIEPIANAPLDGCHAPRNVVSQRPVWLSWRISASGASAAGGCGFAAAAAMPSPPPAPRACTSA